MSEKTAPILVPVSFRDWLDAHRGSYTRPEMVSIIHQHVILPHFNAQERNGELLTE